MKENHFFQEASVSKTREFKVYSNRKEFINNFATGKILLAVSIKLQPDDESVYVGPQIGMNPKLLWGLPILEY